MKFKENFKIIGPGMAIAATGLGAGDIVAASIAGAKYGMAIAWAVIIGCILKYALNEGLGRWQLASGTTIIEGWLTHLGSWARIYFVTYLFFWTLIVCAALIAACGVASHALIPQIPIPVLNTLHAIVISILVLSGKYHTFENIMRVFIAIMFITFIGSAAMITNPFSALMTAFTSAAIPPGSSKFLLGVIGGVGGSLTLLSYAHWIKEKGWKSPEDIKKVHIDLRFAYLLLAGFGLALIVLASYSLNEHSVVIKGTQGVIQMAAMLENKLGVTGKYLFIFGFWCATTTSLLGVWQSVPFLYCEYIIHRKKIEFSKRKSIYSTKSKYFRYFLLYAVVPPLFLSFVGKPMLLILTYSIVGSLFMPFLAITLLLLNSKTQWVGNYSNSHFQKLILIISLILFGYLTYNALLSAIEKLSSL
jgi:Mn2+/Fe2+ NRAMP family transporter